MTNFVVVRKAKEPPMDRDMVYGGMLDGAPVVTLTITTKTVIVTQGIAETCARQLNAMAPGKGEWVAMPEGEFRRTTPTASWVPPQQRLA